jgi:excisionase family DNA binding protein
MYTVQETAEVLRKSVKTVRRYIREGLLSVHRSGKKSVVVPESELKEYMKMEVTEEQRVCHLVNNRLFNRKLGTYN